MFSLCFQGARSQSGVNHHLYLSVVSKHTAKNTHSGALSSLLISNLLTHCLSLLRCLTSQPIARILLMSKIIEREEVLVAAFCGHHLVFSNTGVVLTGWA